MKKLQIWNNIKQGTKLGLILVARQFDSALRIRPHLLPGGLISQCSHVGIHRPMNAQTTRNAKGVVVVEKYNIC